MGKRLGRRLRSESICCTAWVVTSTPHIYYKHTHICTHTCIHTDSHVPIHIHNTHTHTHSHICTHAHAHVHTVHKFTMNSTLLQSIPGNKVIKWHRSDRNKTSGKAWVVVFFLPRGAVLQQSCRGSGCQWDKRLAEHHFLNTPRASFSERVKTRNWPDLKSNIQFLFSPKIQ